MFVANHNGRAVRALVTSVLLAGLFVPMSLSGAGSTRAASGFRDQGTFIYTSGGVVSDLDPANNEIEYADTVERNIDETLIRLAGPSLGSYEPDLATSYSSNANKSVWTFHLRHGVKFHSGRCCLTADDVKYSLGRSAGAGLAGSYMMGRFLDAKDPMTMIKVIDPYTVQFNLGRSTPIFPAAIAQDYNALILDAKAVKAHATKADPWAHNWVTSHDAGTGPYMVQSWQQGTQITLARFKDYWAGWNGKHFSTIVMTTVPGSSTRRELVEKGKATLTFDLTPQDVVALRSNPAVKVTAPYATEIFYVTMTQHGPLASPLARQAISYAFPYDALIHGIYRDQARRAYGPIPSSVLGYDQNMFHYQTDLNKAKQLLQRAGVPQGTTLTYAYDSSVFPEPAIGQLLQASLAQIGVTLKLQALTSAALQNVQYSTDPASKANLIAYSWWPDYNDPYDMAQTLIGSDQKPPNGNNLGFYHNARVDSLLAQMKNADTGTLVRLSKQLQDITGRQDPPNLWLSEPQQTVVTSAKLQGFVANPVELRTYYFYTMHF